MVGWLVGWLVAWLVSWRGWYHFLFMIYLGFVLLVSVCWGLVGLLVCLFVCLVLCLFLVGWFLFCVVGLVPMSSG